MDATAAVASIRSIQGALRLLTALQLTSYLMPPPVAVHDGASFDFIIVGGGTAGLVLANRLTELEHCDVLVIEAGGDPPIESALSDLHLWMANSYADWNYKSEDDGYTQQCTKDHALNILQGKMLGGSSGMDYHHFVRGNPHDYLQWAAAAKDYSWSWEHVYPYFIKSERLEDTEILDSPYKYFHGTQGPIGLTKQYFNMTDSYLQAFKEAGNDVILDINGYKSTGYTKPLLMAANSAHQGTAFSYLSPIKNRPNLHVLRNTQVTEILFNKKKRAIGVHALTAHDEEITIMANKEVIVSAGAINTPQLLMLSGVGPREHLYDMDIDVIVDLPVGQNLQDQTAVIVAHRMGKSKLPGSPQDPHELSIPLVQGYVALNKSQSYPDYSVMNYILADAASVDTFSFENKLQVYGPLLSYCANTVQLKSEICQTFYNANKNKELLWSLIQILHPVSRGKVYLRSKNPKDKPVIYTGYYSHDKDLENMVNYIKHFLKVSDSSMFKRVGARLVEVKPTECGELRPGSRQYWRCYARCVTASLYNFSGTCALGRVVDARLRVRGVRGLRVVDASIAPHTVSGNLLASVVMLAEKAADIIKEEYSDIK